MTVTGSTFTNNGWGILFPQVAYNVTVQGCTFSNNAQSMIDWYGIEYPSFPVGFDNFLISGNTCNNSGEVFCSQAYMPPYSFSNLVIQDNTVTNGTLLNGSVNAPTPDSWTGFEVDGNTIGAGAIDFSSSLCGNNVAVWTDTIRANPSTSGTQVYDYSGTSGPVSVCPDSDLVDLGVNWTPGNIYVKIDPTAERYPTTLAAYPVGYTVTFIAPSETNWVLQADPTWNTLSSNVPVGTGGVTLQVNSDGLFALMPTLSWIEGTPLAYTADAPRDGRHVGADDQRRKQLDPGRGHDPDQRKLPRGQGPARLREHSQNHRRLERGHGDLDPQRRRHRGRLPGGPARRPTSTPASIPTAACGR